jgi:hypothetical protein
MTSTTRRTAARRRTVFGDDGTPIATIHPARSVWLSSLLAECERGHCYVLPENWPADDTGCPRCRKLGLA